VSDVGSAEEGRFQQFWRIVEDIYAGLAWHAELPVEWLERISGTEVPGLRTRLASPNPLDAVVNQAHLLPQVARGEAFREHTAVLVLAARAETAWLRVAGLNDDTCLVAWLLAVFVLKAVGVNFPVSISYRVRLPRHVAAHERWVLACLEMSPEDEESSWEQVLENWPDGIRRLRLDEPFVANQALARYIGGQVVRAQRVRDRGDSGT
jgi:hypothetical protein